MRCASSIAGSRITWMRFAAAGRPRSQPARDLSIRKWERTAHRSSARVKRRDLCRVVDPDRLGVRVLVHGLEAHLATVARAADAAEWRARVDALVRIDPDHSRRDRIGDAMRAA